VLALLGISQAFTQQQKVLVIAIINEPDATDLNPIRMLTTYFVAITYPEMVGWDKDGKVVPCLAESWDISADGLTYTYKLKEGLKWSDGEPLTSEDVAFTFELFTEQSEFWYYLWAPIQVPTDGTLTGFAVRPGAIETPDPRTVVFHLTGASATFFLNAGGNPILPKHFYEGTDWSKQNPDLATLVASGPFIPRQRIPGDRIVFAANPNYFGGKPGLDQVIFKIYRDSTAAEIALQTGEAGFMPNIPGPDVPVLSRVPHLVIGTEQDQINIYVMFNHHSKLADGSVNPVADLKVRKAIAMALDLDNILNASLAGYFQLANQIQVPNMYYLGKTVTNTSIPKPEYPYDPDTAGKLLDEAGYPVKPDGKRFPLTFVMPSGGRVGTASSIKMMQLIQSRLKAVGIEMDLVIMETGSARARIYRAAPPKDWHMALGGISSSPDPDVNAFFMVSSLAGNAGAGGFNAGGYDNPLVNQLTMLGANTTDVDQRVAIYQRISGIVHEDLAVLELYYQTEVLAWNKMYTGFILGLGNPWHDYWGALKHQSLAQVTIVEEATTTTTVPTTVAPAPAAPDYTSIAIGVAILVIIVGVFGYLAGRRTRKGT